jgi:hypothetical protein
MKGIFDLRFLICDFIVGSLATRNEVLSTQYSALSTQYSVLSTQYSELGTQRIGNWKSEEIKNQK